METRAPGPGGQDVLAYGEYDRAVRQTVTSNPYFVPVYTGAPKGWDCSYLDADR